MIHSNVWEPSKIENVISTRWFLSFLNDHTRLSWIFLMTEKSKVNQILKNFNTMIQNQVNTKLQI